MSERERFEEGMPGLLKAMRWAYDNFYIKGYSNSDEREGYISALEDDLPVLFGQVDDLVALVARLARSLRKATPADALADGAMDYLRRKGLNPSPLRTVPEPGQAASGSSQGARSDVQNGVGVGQPEAPTAAPLDMVLHCPKCGEQHVDAPDAPVTVLEAILRAHPLAMPARQKWDNPPHRSHLCHGCGHIWRPADVPTNGVAAVKTKGKNDSPIAHPPARSGAGSEEARDAARYRWLRENVNGLQWESVHDDCGRDLLDGAELDRAIDAASAKPDRSEES